MTKLKVVKDSEPTGYEDYKPILLSTREQLNAYWGYVAPLLERSVEKSMRGEMDVNDIYQGIADGRMYCFVFANDQGEAPEVWMALVMELVQYPKFGAMNLITIAGKELDLFEHTFWKHVCSWAYMNGVQAMEAFATPAMERIMTKFGFKNNYTHMRMDLTEMSHE